MTSAATLRTATKPVRLACVRNVPAAGGSARLAAVASSFGVLLHARRILIVGDADVRLAPGQVVFITGPSGSGKSTALSQIETQCPGACNVQRASFPRDAAVVDWIAPWAPLSEAVSILTACGLGEAPIWVRPFCTLSDGEKFRARLARSVALHTRGDAVTPLICDEFCSNLHRRAAKAIGFNLRKLVTRFRLCAVLACAQDDLIGDLDPDVIVHLRGSGFVDVEERRSRDIEAVPHRRPRAAISFRRRLRIVRGSKRDYERFAAMHYRAADELGFVDKVFVMREGPGGEILGIVVYAHPPLELTLRNQATDGKFLRNPRRLNRSMRILRRLVIHPDVRGCGLGHYLVRTTLPRAGTEYVECLAVMGEHNPVFEKAGMKRIGQYGIHANRRAALDALRELDVDPASYDFLLQVCRRADVRRIVASVVHEWYESTTGGGKVRVERQSPQLLAQTFRGLVGSRPVYYLWRKRQRAARRAGRAVTPKRPKVTRTDNRFRKGITR